MPNSSLPDWLERRYSILRSAFRDKDFTREEAVILLKEKNKDDEKTVAVIISELNKASLIKIRLDENDARKRLYKLEDKFALNSFIENSNKLTRDDVKNLLKRAADLIRTRVDYKFILILLFLKRISDKWEMEYDEAYKETLKDGLNDDEAKEEAKSGVYHDFDLPEEFLWDSIRKDVNRLPEKLSQALKTIAERNSELKDVVDRADFIQFTVNTENSEILRQLVELFSSRKLHHISPDVLGDAYEWILGYFAPQKAKEGEVYTPREVIKLLVEVLDPKPKESVYDPACGSGGMLIIAHKHVEEKFGKSEARKLFLFGEEANQTTYALSKMNMFIHDIRDVDVRHGDTLTYPKFKNGDKLKQFDVVIANPPWNQDGYPEETLKKGEFWRTRFEYGFSPNQSADWAWIQHMLASANETKGRVGIVIDNGCLFRGGKERAIRSSVLEKDIIDCVILLPEKLFYNTGAPGAIIILNKNKPKERKGSVLFINASKEFEQHPEVRKLHHLSDKNIKKIAEAYNHLKNIEGFSRAVPIDEIRRNDYNLNVTLYVFPEEEEEHIDIEKEWTELGNMEIEIEETNKRIGKFLEEIK
jgi:type I restriction enzyme M protein